EQAIPKLEDLGWSLYESGRRTAKEWVASMKSHLGDMWEQSKGHLQDIWNRVNERAKRNQLYSNVDEKINQEPMNSPDVVEKQMTGKVSKPTNPNISIDDLLKSEQVQNIMGDVQGSNTLETIRRIDDFVRLYLKNKDSKFPVQPLDPRKYFGGAWGTVRKNFIHFLTVMDKFGVKAEGVREMIAEMDAKAMVISKYYKELENVFTMHPDKVLKVLDFIAEERVKGTRGMIPDKELVQRGFAPEEVELYKTVRRATASMVDEIRDALLANIKLPEGYSMPKNTTDAKALLDAVSKNPEAPKTLVRDARLIHEINRIADLEKDLHYVPFSRYGKYYVAVKDSSGKVQRLEFYDKKKQAEMREAELRLEHAGDPKTANWRVYSGKNEKPKLAMTYQLTPTTIMFTRHVLEKFHEMGVMNKDLADLYDDLSTIMRKWGDKFPAHLVKAEMVPGWSKDYIRSFASYIQGMGTFVANAKYANRVREAIAKLDPVTDRPLIDWMEQKYAFIKSRNSMSS
ncbi:MAG TPA: hypothetical protein PLN14_07910, partial [Candidatus Hydrothermia bacterium]|nr:hypothetical protein [Candidatus Hydrothermia bacterium]HPO79636.1 hypothetical protein [Candidatus Hydrothermia bacterium]